MAGWMDGWLVDNTPNSDKDRKRSRRVKVRSKEEGGKSEFKMLLFWLATLSILRPDAK